MKTFLTFLLAIIVLPLVTACWTPQKSYWDAEVDRLCAIDGGIRVYETVTLPPKRFDKYGLVDLYSPGQREDTLGSEYTFKWNTHYYKKGQPVAKGAHETAMRRDHIQIVRKSDMKLLGEAVLYHRAGGDFPGPWMPSLYHCPGELEANDIVLIRKVFIKSTERDHQ